MKEPSISVFRTARKPYYWEEMRSLLGFGSWRVLIRNAFLFAATAVILYLSGYWQIAREEIIWSISAVVALLIWFLVAHFISLARASAILWLDTRERIPDQHPDIVGELNVSFSEMEIGEDGNSVFRIRNEHLTQSIHDCYVSLNEIVPIEYVGEGIDTEIKTRDQYFPIFGMLYWLKDEDKLDRITLDPQEMGMALFASVSPGSHSFRLEFYGTDEFSDYTWRNWNVLGYYQLYCTVFGKLANESEFRSYEFFATIEVRDYPSECEIELGMVRKLTEGKGSWWAKRRYERRKGKLEGSSKTL